QTDSACLRSGLYCFGCMYCVPAAGVARGGLLGPGYDYRGYRYHLEAAACRMDCLLRTQSAVLDSHAGNLERHLETAIALGAGWGRGFSKKSVDYLDEASRALMATGHRLC